MRCKFGQKYFAKQAEKQSAEPPKHKWEQYVTPKGLLWQELTLGCEVKKALRKGITTEKQLMAALDDADREQLLCIIGKLRGCLKEK